MKVLEYGHDKDGFEYIIVKNWFSKSKYIRVNGLDFAKVKGNSIIPITDISFWNKLDTVFNKLFK